MEKVGLGEWQGMPCTKEKLIYSGISKREKLRKLRETQLDK